MCAICNFKAVELLSQARAALDAGLSLRPGWAATTPARAGAAGSARSVAEGTDGIRSPYGAWPLISVIRVVTRWSISMLASCPITFMVIFIFWSEKDSTAVPRPGT